MYEPETIYKNYANKGSGSSDIIERKKQRMRWVIKFNENGSCKQLLIDANILEVENEKDI